MRVVVAFGIANENDVTMEVLLVMPRNVKNNIFFAFVFFECFLSFFFCIFFFNVFVFFIDF